MSAGAVTAYVVNVSSRLWRRVKTLGKGRASLMAVVRVWTETWIGRCWVPREDRPEIRARAHFRMSSLRSLKLRATVQLGGLRTEIQDGRGDRG